MDIREAIEKLNRLDESTKTFYVVWYHEKFHALKINHNGRENEWVDRESDFIITRSVVGKGDFGGVPDLNDNYPEEVRQVVEDETIEEVAQGWGWRFDSKEKAENFARECQEKFGHVEAVKYNKGEFKDREFHVIPVQVATKEPVYKDYEDEASSWYHEPHSDYGD